MFEIASEKKKGIWRERGRRKKRGCLRVVSLIFLSIKH
jgi:hypothetical protein